MAVVAMKLNCMLVKLGLICAPARRKRQSWVKHEIMPSLCAVGSVLECHSWTAAAVPLNGTDEIKKGEVLQVQKGSMVAAGAVVASGTNIPPGQLWAGVPAKFLRDLKPNEASFLGVSADTYHRLSEEHAEQAEKRPPFA